MTTLLSQGIQLHVTDEFLASLYGLFQVTFTEPETRGVPRRHIEISDRGQITIRNAENKVMIKTFASGHPCIHLMRIWEGPTKFQMITTGSDRVLRVFDIDGKLLRKIENPHGTKRLSAMIVSESEAYENVLIVTGGHDFAVRMWSLKTAKLKKEMLGHLSPIVSLCFCVGKGGIELIASIDKTGQIRLWNRKSGDCLRIL